MLMTTNDCPCHTCFHKSVCVHKAKFMAIHQAIKAGEVYVNTTDNQTMHTKDERYIDIAVECRYYARNPKEVTRE